MPTIFDRIGPFTEEEERRKEEALKAIGVLGTAALTIPAATALPFQNYLNDTTNIKRQEAMRLFPQADPTIFSKESNLIPSDQNEATSRAFNKQVFRGDPLDLNKTYKNTQSFADFLINQPGTPSSELGSYQQAITSKAGFPEETLEALTVTPAPNPGRFAKDYAEVLADKLGKAINEQQFNYYSTMDSDKGSIPDTDWNDKRFKNTQSKIDALSKRVSGTAGYVWGNLSYPQYTYAKGNLGLNQNENRPNPSVYVSQIDADPFKEADYLYTNDILKKQTENRSYIEGVPIDPRVTFKQAKDLGPSTGPSYGINPAKDDISFRKGLINSRGELTTGDLQALLAERKLPFAYQLKDSKNRYSTPSRFVPINNAEDVLKQNILALAKAENTNELDVVKQFARLIPNVGEPTTPPTPAVTGMVSNFPSEGQLTKPANKVENAINLRQIGILPPPDKASYPSKVTVANPGFDDYSKKYSSLKLIPDNFNDDDFGVNKKYNLIIDRDKLRPAAVNKLLNRTVSNLIKQAEPIKGLGLGGFATGGIATAMDPAVIDALSRGDYMQAGTTAALNTAIGSAVGGATAKGLQALQALGYARPAAAVASSLPLAGGVLSGLALGETGKAINRAYKQNTGKDWADRNKPKDYDLYTGPTPTIQPRTGTAILGGRPVQVPYGSIAGQKTVGRPWWDKAGSQIEKFANLLNSGSVIGR